jgi:hypothetical protein
MAKPASRLVWAYPLLFLAYAVYSFAHVDPNLVLTDFPGYWAIQQELWRFGLEQRLWSSLVYLGLMAGMFGVYMRILGGIARKEIRGRQLTLALTLVIGALLVSYPALSHDIFNYMFNAKAVWFYGADPHVQTAMDFPGEPWLPFMHNIHTPAPYGVGWTWLSVIPSFLGQNHLQLTLILFRLFILGFLLALLWLMRKVGTVSRVDWWALALNPLVLVETVSNIHNDVVMMGLAMGSIYLVLKWWRSGPWYWLVMAAAMWVVSVSIKFATILLPFGWLAYYGLSKTRWRLSWAGVQSVTHFLPLLTARSQRFLPWYMIWPLTFVPLVKESGLKRVWLAFSGAAMLSYLPFLYRGEYTPEVQLQRQLITFLPPLSLMVTTWWLERKK